MAEPGGDSKPQHFARRRTVLATNLKAKRGGDRSIQVDADKRKSSPAYQDSESVIYQLQVKPGC
jgi:hypothetical protein